MDIVDAVDLLFWYLDQQRWQRHLLLEESARFQQVTSFGL